MVWKKGETGNAKGRPKGTATAQLRAVISESIPDIVAMLVEQALAGDSTAAKILLDRVLPPLKQQAESVTVKNGKTLAAKGDAVIKSTLGGHIPPDIGSQLITALAAQGKLVELDELTKRIEALESKK